VITSPPTPLAGDPARATADDLADEADQADDASRADDLAEPDADLPPLVLRRPPGADPSIDWGERAHLQPDGAPRLVERVLVVPPELAGLRLDHFLKTQIRRLSRTKLQQVIATQLARDDARDAIPRAAAAALKPAATVVAGERYRIVRPARAEPACPRTFTVVHDEPRLFVIDKPAGLPVHASAKFFFNTLTRVLAERFPDNPGQICHRLDRETSGCLVVARDPAAAARLKQAFADKRVKKTYLAIVHGTPPWPGATSPAPDDDGPNGATAPDDDGPPGSGDDDHRPDHLLDAPLRVSRPGDPTAIPGVRIIPGPGPGALPSETLVRVLAHSPDRAYSLIRCLPRTGRQHQIRVHLAHAGYPIVGDKLYTHGDAAFMAYCDQGLTDDLAATFTLWRHALHAASVTFPHPDDGHPVTAEAPLPAELANLLR
jgi:23S rRNA pseudouridine1911/1915/1917 synthase